MNGGCPRISTASCSASWTPTGSGSATRAGWSRRSAGEDMESISQTAAYLFTHMGLGLVERDPLDVDYDLRFLSHMLPGLSDDGYRSTKGADGTYGAGSGRAFRYTEDDVSMKGEGRGRMVGDISGTDWLDFAMSPLSYPLRMTYFGSASQRNIRTVAVEREYRAPVGGLRRRLRPPRRGEVPVRQHDQDVRQGLP